MSLAAKIEATIQEAVQKAVKEIVQKVGEALLEEANVILTGQTRLSSNVSSTTPKKRGRRPSKAAKFGVSVGQRWEGRQKMNAGRLIEVVALGKDMIHPRVLKGKKTSKKIKYENLKSSYKLV